MSRVDICMADRRCPNHAQVVVVEVKQAALFLYPLLFEAKTKRIARLDPEPQCGAVVDRPSSFLHSS